MLTHSVVHTQQHWACTQTACHKSCKHALHQNASSLVPTNPNSPDFNSWSRNCETGTGHKTRVPDYQYTHTSHTHTHTPLPLPSPLASANSRWWWSLERSTASRRGWQKEPLQWPTWHHTLVYTSKQTQVDQSLVCCLHSRLAGLNSARCIWTATCEWAKSWQLIFLTLFTILLSANSKNLRKFTAAISLKERSMYVRINQ